MNKVVFSSWAGNIVDNRGLEPDKYASVDNLEFPLEHDGRRLGAFMSWNGVVVADSKVNIIGIAHSYLKEVNVPTRQNKASNNCGNVLIH